MSNIAILSTGLAVEQSAFSEPKFDIFGLLSGFKFNNKTYSYFNIQYYTKPKNVKNQKAMNALSNGFYVEHLFYEYLYYLNNPSLYKNFNEETLIKDGFLQEKELKPYEVNADEIVTIKSADFTEHSYFYEEAILKFKIQKDINGKIKKYAENGETRYPQTIEEGLVSKQLVKEKDLSNLPSGKFYFKNFGTPQTNWDINKISENTKIELDKIITLISFKCYWIEKEIFPLIMTDFTYVDNLGNGIIQENDPHVTELIKALAAIKKSWGYYNNFTPIFDIINPSIEEYTDYYKMLISFYDDLNKMRYNLLSKSDNDKLKIISWLLSGDALKLLPLSTRKYLIKQYANQKLLLDPDEIQVLKLINTINVNNKSEVNDFLGWLISEKEKANTDHGPFKKNIYSLLYEKIGNYSDFIKMLPELVGIKTFSQDNKTRFVDAIYVLWTESMYNPYSNVTNGQPDFSLIDNSTYIYDKTYKHSVIIDYRSEKKFGIYDDDFNFLFDSWGNGIYTVIDKNFTLTAESSNHLYQPVTLVHYPSENDTSIQLPYKDGDYNGAIPLFYLKFIDDVGDEKDMNAKIGYFIDVATIATGIGNLAKLRHLRQLSRLGQALVIIETVQISAGIVNFILTFACNEGNTFCKKVKTLLTFIEISSLVTDPLVVAKTKKAAQEAVETAALEGWPSDFINTADGQLAKSKIEELSQLNINQFLLKYKNKIKSDFNELVLANPQRFENIHSAQQIDEYIELGFNKGLSIDEITGLILISCRKDKLLHHDTLIEQMLNWATDVKKRKFPYKFETLQDFEIFKNRLIQTLNDFGIPAYDIRIQGSCLRSKNPNDVDIAVFLKDSDFDYIKELSINEIGARNGDKKILVNKMKKEINHNASNGVIKSMHFPRTTHNHGLYTFSDWLYDYRDVLETCLIKKVNVSIMKKGAKLENPPYIYIK